ncbi:MAG: hypothetical protein ACYS9X_08550 [Planctomycetota bacterium]
MALALALAIVGGLLTVIGTVGFLMEARIGLWEPRVLFCLHTLGLVALGAAAVLFLTSRIRKLEDKLGQMDKRPD